MDKDNDKLTIDRPHYVLAVFILSCEELKEDGLIEGGPIVNREVLSAIKVIGESMGFSEPTSQEIVECVDVYKAGGLLDQDLCNG